MIKLFPLKSYKILGFVAIAIGLGFLAHRNNQLRDQLLDTKLALKEKERDLAAREADLRLCFDDRARIDGRYSLPYSHEVFLIASPLFAGKDIDVQLLSYRGNIIRQMALEVSTAEFQSEPVIVKVWRYLDVPYERQAIFDDYQHVEKPWLLQGEEGNFVNAHGLIMRRSLGRLQFSRQFSSNHSIFVSIAKKDWQPHGIYPGERTQAVRESTRTLEGFADTIMISQ